MKILLVFIVILILVISFLLNTNSGSSKNSNNPKPKMIQSVNSPTPTEMIYSSINTTTGTYAYLIGKMNTDNQIMLINNTQTEQTSKDLMTNNGCINGINGGFYTTDDKPLGWMVIDGILVNKSKDSDLLNGYISVKDNQILIGKQKINSATYGLQTGPLLITNSEVWNLKMARDKPSRRMVMGNTDQGIIIMAVFDHTAELSGPNLTDLPSIVKNIGDKEGIIINNAVNLDGGSASAIYTPGGNLPEVNNVGSWWCVR